MAPNVKSIAMEITAIECIWLIKKKLVNQVGCAPDHGNVQDGFKGVHLWGPAADDAPEISRSALKPGDTFGGTAAAVMADVSLGWFEGPSRAQRRQCSHAF